MASIIKVWMLLVMAWHTNGWQRLCEEDQTFCDIGICATPHCSHCDESNAVCHTSDEDEPVPKTLSIKTQHILIHYNGKPTNIDGEMFRPYYALVNITMYGNFISISPGTFQNHMYLTSLILSHTQISSLPTDLFNDNSLLHHLRLPNNNFTAVPENVFHSIKLVTFLDFSFNPIQVCGEHSIGDQFRHLSRLEAVYLDGLGGSADDECSLNGDFLLPLADVDTLGLSGSKILQLNHRLLRQLRGVKGLILNNLETYKSCPALANKLFQHLPPSLTSLSIEGWRTNLGMPGNCSLTEASFDPLRGSRLTKLNLRYSDGILGSTLTPLMFDGIVLKVLDLSWCRLKFDGGAFDSLNQLTDLSLTGNQLGPRKLELFSNHNLGSQLNNLALMSTGVFSEKHLLYQLGYVLAISRNIKVLLLNGNNIVNLPRFSVPGTLNISYLKVISLNFDENRLVDLSMQTTHEMCLLMPNLTTFSAQNNFLREITGICKTVTDLILTNNFIGSNPGNLEAVKNLVNVKRLEFTRNSIKQLPFDLAHKLVKLRSFLFAGNDINHIPANLFRNNPNLDYIDLSSNLLTSIDLTMLQYSPHLAQIYLQHNLISNVEPDISDRFDILTNNKSLWILDIVGNPFDCSCADEHLQAWVRTSKIVANAKNLTCGSSDEHRLGNHVYNYTLNEFYCKWLTTTYIGSSVLLAIILSLPLGICVYKNRWYISNMRVVAKAMVKRAQQVKLEQLSKYDAFISYDFKSDEDNNWVMEHLIPALEGESELEIYQMPEIEGTTSEALAPSQSQSGGVGHRLYIHERDSVIGTQKYTELCKAVEDSRKLIILLSNSYLASYECLNEANLLAGCETDGAQCYHPDRILILVIEELDKQMIRPPITGLIQQNYIDVTPAILGNSRKMKDIWARVRKFISKPTLVFKKDS